jgi:hypothetical protein
VRLSSRQRSGLSARLDLAMTVGHWEGIGRGLVSEDEARNLE